MTYDEYRALEYVGRNTCISGRLLWPHTHLHLHDELSMLVHHGLIWRRRPALANSWEMRPTEVGWRVLGYATYGTEAHRCERVGEAASDYLFLASVDTWRLVWSEFA